MKKFARHSIVAFFVVVALLLGSCSDNRVKRQPRTKFQVVTIDKVAGSISDGWRITLTVANNTASNIRITSANAYVRQSGKKVGRLVLDGEVLIPRRRCSQVEIPLRITLANPIAALGALNKIRKGDFEGITIDYSITLSALASHRIIEEERVSLDDLARRFNLGLKK